MSPRVFIITDIVSGLAWAPVYILPGYLSATAFA
jgi:membrane protein DedA with SNARE-associated domain